MKRFLLILMVLASVAMAGDRQMKALIVGTWAWDDENGVTYQADGTVLLGRHNYQMKWDVKNGELIQTPLPDGGSTDRVIWPDNLTTFLLQVDVFTILFLTKHEFLIREKSSGSYIFMSR